MNDDLSTPALHGWLGSLLLGILCFTVALVHSAQGADSEARDVLTLRLTDGGFVQGTLCDSDAPDTIRWQSPMFVEPFDFQASAISVLHFPKAPEPVAPKGDYCIELLGNDVIFGSVMAITADAIEIDTATFGRVRIDRSHVSRLYRWRGSADLVYLGPNGLTGWSEPGGKKLWREESGHLATAQEMATIFGDLEVPARASIEFELSWQKRPDFVLALGASDDPRSLQRAFRFEVWEDELIVLREGTNEADLASIQQLPTGAGRVQLQAYIDQEKGQILVYSNTGKKLAELNIPDAEPTLLPGIWLANKQGDLRLERLRIVRWSGEPPVEVEADKARVHQLDGTVMYGNVERLDVESGQVSLTRDGQPVQVPFADIDGIYLPVAGEQPVSALRVSYQDGTRLSGNLMQVRDRALWLTVPGVSNSVRAPMDGLFSVSVLRQELPVGGADQNIGKLQMANLELRGRLVDGQEQEDRSCLVWRPAGSMNASAMLPGMSGRIVYRNPPPPRPAYEAQVREEPRTVIGQFFKVFSDTGSDTRARPGAPHALHLRTGDSIPCEVTKIDEQGVTFTAPVSDATFIEHGKIKALELITEPVVARIDRAKRDRLLTLPRMQRDNPPTHLIRSRSGDYLRARLVSMDEQSVQLEVRLENRAVPRDRVSRIIWLHEDELAPEEITQAEPHTRVQAVRRDGIRLTFQPKRFSGTTIEGTSAVLGMCQVTLEDVDQLLIGAEIEQEAASLAFHQWRLQNAPDPRAFVDDGDAASGSGTQPGTESGLVGQPASDFQLDMLDGSRFQLDQQRGKVVVLDFWATWCGPCVRSMPEVERVCGELKDEGVVLVAVNMQESADKIKDMLERHKLNVPVALDLDGVVAERYRVTAIPQTVIIDREGNVARCFIGGGAQFGANLQNALRAVLDESGDSANQTE